MGVHVAVVGVTGAVGTQMLRVLESRKFPADKLTALASARSVGRKVTFRGREISVQELRAEAFEGVRIALFSIPKNLSRQFSPEAARRGCVVVDNSNAFRMEPDVPLVVPEVNAHAIRRHKGIIANPNCSTIQMVVALKPIHDAARIKRIVVTTFQSVSGVGLKAVDELLRESRAYLAQERFENKVFPHPIAFNCIPQIPQSDAFEPNLYTTEEMKMVRETQKIMEDDSIRVTSTTVRVPVFYAHSESVNIETERKLTVGEAREILSKAPGVKVIDDPATQRYPLARSAEGTDDVFVGRIREDESIPAGLNLWIVADNLRKGAALNAVQIAERLL
ncbi:MAG: aspartate-semialdehyde dehydrogenase [Planctomycetota bacterium]